MYLATLEPELVVNEFPLLLQLDERPQNLFYELLVVHIELPIIMNLPSARSCQSAKVRFWPIVLKMSSGNHFGMPRTSKQSVIVQ